MINKKILLELSLKEAVILFRETGSLKYSLEKAREIYETK